MHCVLAMKLAARRFVSSQAVESRRTDEMNARTFDTDGAFNYLDVRYSESARPYTEYPGKLTEHLTREYLAGYRGSKLLDLGCGRGEFLHGFARQGFDATGIDRSRPSQPKFSEPVVEG